MRPRPLPPPWADHGLTDDEMRARALEMADHIEATTGKRPEGFTFAGQRYGFDLRPVVEAPRTKVRRRGGRIIRLTEGRR